MQKTCKCGCGAPTNIAKMTDARKGIKKGDAYDYVRGHSRWSLSPEKWIVDPITNCWIWQRYRNERGYGVQLDKRRKRNRYAHVIQYEEKYGPVPVGMELDHFICQNPPCVNPDHVEPVSHAINVRRGRLTKLTVEQVAEIRSARGIETQKQLAERFGIAQGYVSQLQCGRGWKDH